MTTKRTRLLIRVSQVRDLYGLRSTLVSFANILADKVFLTITTGLTPSSSSMVRKRSLI